MSVSQYILTVSGGSSVVSVTVSGSESQTNVTGLLPDTEYSVTVVAVDMNGQTSLPSVSVIASTAQIGKIHLYKGIFVFNHHNSLSNFLPVPLITPNNLMLGNIGISWIVLSWKHSSTDIVSYIVTVSGAGKEDNVTVEGKSSANVTDLIPGTDYRLRVTAVSNDGRVSPSSDVLTTATLFAGELISKVWYSYYLLN